MAATRLRLRPPGARSGRREAAGQSTQMIVGADGADDREVLARSAELYGAYRLRRVYYSAFSPIPDSSAALPLERTARRENRLYRADWLFRFYGFTVEEILAGGAGGMLELGLDPKLALALSCRLRSTARAGISCACRGSAALERILQARRHGSLRYADLARLRVPMRRAALSSSPPTTIRDGSTALPCAGSWRHPTSSASCPPMPDIRLAHATDFDGWRKPPQPRRHGRAAARRRLAGRRRGAAGCSSAGTERPSCACRCAFCSWRSRLRCTPTPALGSQLHRLLWRLVHGERHLLDLRSDADVARAQGMVRAVRRAAHKMKAFLRFKEVWTSTGPLRRLVRARAPCARACFLLHPPLYRHALSRRHPLPHRRLGWCRPHLRPRRAACRGAGRGRAG